MGFIVRVTLLYATLLPLLVTLTNCDDTYLPQYYNHNNHNNNNHNNNNNDNVWTYEGDDEEAIGHEEEDEIERRLPRGHPPYRHQLRNSVGAVVMTKPPSTTTTTTTTNGPLTSNSVDGEQEPSCEELRTIWRLTKRAAMRSLVTNDIPTHTVGTFGHILHTPQHDEYGQVVIKQQPPRSTSTTKYVHGKKVYQASDMPFGGGVGGGMRNTLRSRTAGSYERVEEQLRKGLFAEKPFVNTGKKIYASRSRHLLSGDGPMVYGTYSQRGGLLTTTQPVVTNDQRHLLKAKQVRERQRMDKMAKTMLMQSSMTKQDQKDNRKERNGFSTDTSGCVNVYHGKWCDSRLDCSCYGFYTCTAGQCQPHSTTTATATSTATTTNNRDGVGVGGYVSGVWGERGPVQPSVRMTNYYSRLQPEVQQQQEGYLTMKSGRGSGVGIRRGGGGMEQLFLSHRKP